MTASDDDPDPLPETGDLPVLYTPRLTLRALTLDDADDLLTIFGDLDVIRYANADLMRTPDEAREMVAYFSTRFTRPHTMRWGITRRNDSDTVIGTGGYHGITRLDSESWGVISYDLARVHWGRGFMTEALQAVIAYGFDSLGFNRIEAETFPQNRASARVLEKLGFVKESSAPELRRWTLWKHDWID